MSELGAILQAWADKQPVQPVTDAGLGRALGVTRQTVGNWRAGLSRLPDPHQLRKVATLTGTDYRTVLEAALVDAGYLQRESLDGHQGHARPTGTRARSTRSRESHDLARDSGAVSAP